MFDPDSISQSKLMELRRAAEHAWSDETRPEDSRGHPQSSAGQCYVTSAWLANKVGGHVGTKDGHFFTVTPDKNYVIDLTGDQNASEPAKGDGRLLDEEDEPYEFDAEQLRHRPGPIIYTQVTNPLYKDFRIPAPVDDHSRAKLFAERANAALEGKLNKQADSGGSGSDAYPGQGPQAEEEFNLRDFHDPVIDDLNLSMEEPVEHEYKFMYGGGGLKVSPVEGHEQMAEEAGIGPDHSGPMAVGFVNVRGRDALWSVETNIGLRGLVKVLKDFTKQQKWTWGGLVDSSGNSIHDDFSAKKSFWYGWRDGELKLSASPFWGSFDEIEVVGRTASLHRAPNPFALAGLEEWAEDFGYRLADYPGGTDMNDRIKNKEWPTTYDKGDPEADPGKAFDGEPQGELTCPYCDEVLPNFKAYVMHTQDHQDPEMQPIDDGHFPTIRPLDEPLGFGTQSQPTAIPVIGAIQQDSWDFPQPEGWHFGSPMMKLEFLPANNAWIVLFGDHQIPIDDIPGVGTKSFFQTPQEASTLLMRVGLELRADHSIQGAKQENPQHPDPWMDSEPGTLTIPEHWSFVAAGGKEGKDLLQAPIPFIYDVERDFVTVGHPGMHTHEIMGQFTPGGIVEGYYEPKGQMTINTTTTIPFSCYHLMQLWYFSHPGLEITSLEIENQSGDRHKVASADVGTYIKSITADGEKDE